MRKGGGQRERENNNEFVQISLTQILKGKGFDSRVKAEIKLDFVLSMFYFPKLYFLIINQPFKNLNTILLPK